jgi:hypothetical protein
MNSIPPGGGSERTARRPTGARPRGVAIDTCVEIAAPAGIVWELVSDLEGWSQWNPLYRRVAGSLEIGETITMTVTIPGTKTIDLRPKVIAVIANELVHYQGTTFGGLVRGTRYIEIRETGAESCVLSNGEIMGGLLGLLLGRLGEDRIRMGLELMSEALKKVAEGRWQGRSARAYSRGVT